MKALMGILFVLSLLPIGSLASAQNTVFFEEQFSGPTLDPSIWRTEILTSGARFCCDYAGLYPPGHWVDEGVECHGVAAYSPYGSATLSDGLLHLSSSNVRAFPFLVSRLPGSAPLFPPSGDFTLKVRLRFDRVTPWGVGLVVFQTESTEPIGDNRYALAENVLLEVWCDAPGEGIRVSTALGGSYGQVAVVPPATEFHEFVLECVGNSFTISVDGEAIYGPVSSALRPTAVFLGNPPVAFWGPTDWTSFSIDYLRVELPGPATGACCFSNGVCLQGTQADCQSLGGSYVGDGVPCDPDPCGPTPVRVTTWGQVKSLFR